ncbi:MAG: MFS transporter, partial [Desulfuromonadaceae bacterium]|nr:MFS transporter [Desulfuromonadaceae bacterium]
SPTVFGWALDTFRDWQPYPGIHAEWGIAFLLLGIGGFAGPVFMWLLRRRPESIKMAGGKR